MSSGSSEVAHPTWQKALFAIPAREQTLSQTAMIKSITVLTPAITTLFEQEANINAFDTPDYKNKELKTALGEIAQVAVINGGLSRLRYYVKEKNRGRFNSLLQKASFQFLSPSQKTPEVIVLQLISSVILSAQHVEFQEAATAEEARIGWALSQMWSEIISDYSKLMIECDNYLEKELGFTLSSSPLVMLFEENALSLACSDVARATGMPNTASGIDVPIDTCRVCLKEVEEGLQATSPWSGDLVPCGIFTKYLNFDHQMKLLSKIYQKNMKFRENLREEWWEVAAVYVDLLKKALAKAQTPALVDWFIVASLHQRLLHAMVCGVSKTVSYQEIEKVTREMEAAAEKAVCPPPRWKLEIKNDVKIVREDVLPFIRSKGQPSAYKTAPFAVFTPGFLKLYSGNAVLERLYRENGHTCAACGVKGIVLMKCSGVG
jgi:hypothetical protein